MRVGLVVDHPKRDLGGAVSVAHALALRGAETCLIPLYYQGLDVPLLDVDVLLVNYARPVNFELVRGYVEQGIPVLVMDTEGGVLAEQGANSVPELTEYIRRSGYAHLLSGYLFWGDLLRDAFAEDSILTKGALHVTGCPRFDFASPRWRETLVYPIKDYILVNTNFPLVNPAFTKDAGAETEAMVGRGWTQEYVSKMVEDQKKILAGLLLTVRDLAQRFPQRHFLVRPHPFEGQELYHTSFVDVGNVTVDGSGDVLNILSHCACLLHLNCGTSVEAVMLGRLPVSMDFLNTEHMAKHSLLPSRISLKADSFEHLVAILEALEAGSQSFDFDGVYRTHIHRFFHKNDGAAGDRVAETLLATPSRTCRQGVFGRIAWSLASSRTISSAGQRLQAAVANIVGTRAAAWLRSRVQVVRQDKALDIDVVRYLTRLLAQLDNQQELVIGYARHPVSGFPLSSILIRPSPAAGWAKQDLT